MFIAVWASILIHAAGFLGFELAFANRKESFPQSEPRTVTIVSISSVTSPLSLPKIEAEQNNQGKVLEQSFSKISEQKENELQDEIMEKPITSEIVSNNISIDKQEDKILFSKNDIILTERESGDGGSTETQREEILTTEPIPLTSIEPNYPFRARKKGLEGVVVLKVIVSKLGVPVSCLIIDSSGYKDLDDAAKKTVLSSQFYPGTLNGEEIESTLRISIRFQLNKL